MGLALHEGVNNPHEIDCRVQERAAERHSRTESEVLTHAYLYPQLFK